MTNHLKHLGKFLQHRLTTTLPLLAVLILTLSALAQTGQTTTSSAKHGGSAGHGTTFQAVQQPSASTPVAESDSSNSDNYSDNSAANPANSPSNDTSSQPPAPTPAPSSTPVPTPAPPECTGWCTPTNPCATCSTEDIIVPSCPASCQPPLTIKPPIYHCGCYPGHIQASMACPLYCVD